MIKRLLVYISAVFALLLPSGCCETIHEYPDTGAASVTLTLEVKNDAPEIYTVVDYTSGKMQIYGINEWQGMQTRAFDAPLFERYYLGSQVVDADKWNLRIVYEIYYGGNDEVKRGKGDLITRQSVLLNPQQSFPTHDIKIDLPEGVYTLLSWADYVPAGSEEDYFYDTSNLGALLSDIDKRINCEDNDLRDCFAKVYKFSVENVMYLGEAKNYKTTLIRPQGRYVVLGCDYQDYLKFSDTPVEENRVELLYPTFVNVGYSVPEARPNEGAEGLTYVFRPARYIFDNEEMVCLADDYSFVNGKESLLRLDMKVINPAEKIISSNTGIEIPIYADKLTIVIGNFLANSKNSGGLSVSDAFEDEIVIPYIKRNQSRLQYENADENQSD